LCPVSSVASSASLIVATIGVIEIPIGLWDDAFFRLQKFVFNCQGVSKIPPLQAIGYICKDIQDTSTISHFTLTILNTITSCLRKHSPQNMDNDNKLMPDEVILATLSALSNATPFAGKELNSDEIRNYILTSLFDHLCILDSWTKTQKDIYIEALKCLIEMCKYFCKYFVNHMERIFTITMGAIEYGSNKRDEDIINLGLEFWSTLLKRISKIDSELKKSEENKTLVVTSNLHHVTELAAPALIPVLFNVFLTKVWFHLFLLCILFVY
jgi:hypothetical protein